MYAIRSYYDAATFGGFNFMEFSANDKVIVNPLRIKSQLLNELAYNIVLYYTVITSYSIHYTKLYDGKSIGVFTDIGEPCDNVTAHFAQCHSAFS